MNPTRNRSIEAPAAHDRPSTSSSGIASTDRASRRPDWTAAPCEKRTSRRRTRSTSRRESTSRCSRHWPSERTGRRSGDPRGRAMPPVTSVRRLHESSRDHRCPARPMRSPIMALSRDCFFVGRSTDLATGKAHSLREARTEYRRRPTAAAAHCPFHPPTRKCRIGVRAGPRLPHWHPRSPHCRSTRPRDC